VPVKIGVVGGGAMGSLFAALFSHDDVWLYEPVNNAHVREIQCHGLTIEEMDRHHRTVRLHATSVASEVGVCDVIALFVKAPVTQDALAGAEALIGSETIVLSLQNGIGIREQIERHVPRERIFRGVTSHGATFVGPGLVRHAGVGQTKVGPVSQSASEGSCERIKTMLQRAGIPFAFEPSTECMLWEKVIINAGINALTALMDVPNGELVQDPQLLSVMRSAVDEASAVARAMGYELGAAEMRAEVERVARATATNISSMLQDVRAGRQTEIGFINGAIIRYGAENGIEVPTNTLLARMVQRIDEGWRG